MRQDLRYKISNWEQATQCLSNNSRKLSIQTTRFLMDRELEGFIIKVNHTTYGTLFAALTEGSGLIISDTTENGIYIPFMTTDQILDQLEKLGFIIYYAPDVHLSGDQLSFFITLQQLGFDKLTVVRKYAKGNRIISNKIIAFDSTHCADLLQYGVKLTDAQFANYLAKGYIFNISDSIKNSPSFVWDWLTYVCNISDVLEANTSPGVVDITHTPHSAPVPFDYELMSQPVPPEESYYGS